MKGRSVAIVAAFLFLVGAFAALSFNDADSANDTTAITHLHGYVFDIPAQQERGPLAEVKVTTMISFDKEYESVYTDSNGSFTVQYNSEVKYITFNIAEYTVKGWCSELLSNGNTGIYTISLKDNSQINGVHELYDDSGYTAIVTRSNAAIHGYVTSTIDSQTVFIENASITIMSDKTMLTTTSNKDGYFEFDCSTGIKYTLKVTHGGFENVILQNIAPSEEDLRVDMIQKDNSMFLGWDSAHSLAAVCLLIALAITAIAFMLYRRPEKEGGLFFINDLPPKAKKRN